MRAQADSGFREEPAKIYSEAAGLPLDIAVQEYTKTPDKAYDVKVWELVYRETTGLERTKLFHERS